MKIHIKQLWLGLLALAVVVSTPVLSLAQSTPIFSVSSDLAQVKSDILAWAVALIGVVLAIYAFRRVKSIIH